jgi:hypothetical protein
VPCANGRTGVFAGVADCQKIQIQTDNKLNTFQYYLKKQYYDEYQEGKYERLLSRVSSLR